MAMMTVEGIHGRVVEDFPGTSGEAQRRPLGELMVMEGLITNSQLKEALHMQAGRGGRLGERLIGLGHITAVMFERFLARQPGVSSIVLSNCRVSADLVAMIPREFAIERQVFPIDRLGKLLTVAMVCPLDRKTLADLHELTGLSVKPMLCTEECIKRAIRRYYPDEDGFTATTLDRGEMYKLRMVQG